ncbi:MAG: ribonuclease Z [Bacteroidota bacterium]
MKVTILGNNSALPTYERHPTSQIVYVHDEPIMLDCGEATQIQMQRYGIRWRNLNHIFISHMHGDHYFGLPGFINSMSLLGRTTPLHLYAPAPLEALIQHIMDVASSVLSYPFHFHALPDGAGTLVDNEQFRVSCFPVEHRITCHGFVITRKTKGRKLLLEKCREYEIPAYYYDKLKKGEDYERKDGFLVKNEWVTELGPKPKRYAYCADTLYTESILPYITGVDTMYHESTYLENDIEKAIARFHSTAKQAALLAVKAQVQQLLLGHFSSKYRELEAFKEEAGSIFRNAIITEEGQTYEI